MTEKRCKNCNIDKLTYLFEKDYIDDKWIMRDICMICEYRNATPYQEKTSYITTYISLSDKSGRKRIKMKKRK